MGLRLEQVDRRHCRDGDRTCSWDGFSKSSHGWSDDSTVQVIDLHTYCGEGDGMGTYMRRGISAYSRGHVEIKMTRDEYGLEWEYKANHIFPNRGVEPGTVQYQPYVVLPAFGEMNALDPSTWRIAWARRNNTALQAAYGTYANIRALRDCRASGIRNKVCRLPNLWPRPDPRVAENVQSVEGQSLDAYPPGGSSRPIYN
ncbi:hypothetical protein BDZ91DRAFT_767306 [Kalaharituber pfeilii]|nr:hypothetical protein BDZ91DRAFT_767306 [Kalaharituber pfeilii]